MTYMNKYSVVLTSHFKEKLADIYSYISFTLKSRDFANKLFQKVKKSVLNLTYFLQRYSKFYNSRQNLRKLPIDKYVVIYEIDDNTRTGIYSTYFSW